MGLLIFLLVVFFIRLLSFFAEEYIKKQKIKEREKRILEAGIIDLTPEEFEHYVAGYLRNNGYNNVSVTQQSGDFGADVLATSKTGNKICVQCKKYSKPVGVKAVQEVFAARSYYDCDEAWVFATCGYTKSAIELAKRNGVYLKAIDYDGQVYNIV